MVNVHSNVAQQVELNIGLPTSGYPMSPGGHIL